MILNDDHYNNIELKTIYSPVYISNLSDVNFKFLKDNLYYILSDSCRIEYKSDYLRGYTYDNSYIDKISYLYSVLAYGTFINGIDNIIIHDITTFETYCVIERNSDTKYFSEVYNTLRDMRRYFTKLDNEDPEIFKLCKFVAECTNKDPSDILYFNYVPFTKR